MHYNQQRAVETPTSYSAKMHFVSQTAYESTLCECFNLISLSIWFHNRSELAHQQEDVKQFLLGLKSDLKNDLEEIQNDQQSYQYQKAAFSYITNVKLNNDLNIDSLQYYDNWIFNTTALNPNNGRFEGFKSSGKIGEIENKELQNDIMDLYQEDIVSLLASTNNYVTIKRKFFNFIDKWIAKSCK